MPSVNAATYFGWRHTKHDQSRITAPTDFVGALLVPSGSRDVHFARAEDEETDWNVSNPTNPTFYFHSATTPATDYLSVAHDGTSATITVAGGYINLTGGDVVIADTYGLLVGSATQVTISDGDGATDVIPEVQVLGTGAADGAALIAAFNTTNTRAVAPRLALVKGAAATQVATTAVANDEVVGVIIVHASDGTDFETPVGAIQCVVDDPGGPGTGAIGGSWEFYTTADGGETLTLSFTVGNDQNLYIANNNGIFIGTTSGVGTDATNELQVLGTGSADSSMTLGHWAAAATEGRIHFVKSRNATIGSFTIVQSGDDLGTLSWFGDDGVDYGAYAARIRVQVDATPGVGDMPGRIIVETTADGAETGTERLRITSAGIIGVAAGASIRASTSTEIAISVTNDAVTVGSEGTLIIPYLDSTDAAFTDGVGGNIDGAIGVQRDNDTGPTVTLEVRANGSWLSVAVSGYIHQNRVPWMEQSTFLSHPKQRVYEDGSRDGLPEGWYLDESLCFVCGEPMTPGEQATFWVNGVQGNRGIHSVFGHTHLEQNEVIKGLTARIEALEAELEMERGSRSALALVS